jgi:hypothetical protein
MHEVQSEDERKQAWIDVKTAVRAYARNPSTSTAEKVEACWKAIRKCDGVLGPRTSNPLSRPKYRSHLTPVPTHPVRERAAQITWPINDIVMRSLLLKGMNEQEIAEMFHVPAEIVHERRKSFAL